jgi:hypothetical protein
MPSFIRIFRPRTRPGPTGAFDRTRFEGFLLHAGFNGVLTFGIHNETSGPGSIPPTASRYAVKVLTSVAGDDHCRNRALLLECLVLPGGRRLYRSTAVLSAGTFLPGLSRQLSADLTLLVGFKIRLSDLAFGERVPWDTNYGLARENYRHQ